MRFNKINKYLLLQNMFKKKLIKHIKNINIYKKT